jgi:hypothetical protein
MIIPHVPTDRLGSVWFRSSGLTANQALEAGQRYGPNDIVEAVEHPWWALARDTARDPSRAASFILTSEPCSPLLAPVPKTAVPILPL